MWDRERSSRSRPQRAHASPAEISDSVRGLRMNNTPNDQTNGIATLLGQSELRSAPFNWNSLAIERRIIKAGEKPRQPTNDYSLLLWEKVPAVGEIEVKQGTFEPYTKMPGTITTLAPGFRPAARSAMDQPLIVCSLRVRFLHELELELDQRPTGPFQSLKGTNDSGLRRLMLQLTREAGDLAEKSVLKTESLFVELGTRLLFVARSMPQRNPNSKPDIPRPVLRRVLDRMHAQLDTKLSLSTLAAESGYSRAQFIRMFKATMGVAPHSHLVELRLRRAQELIASRNLSLLDIALECGFQNHAHFSTAFARRFGTTPSLYRKSLIASYF
jgi:AraC family transcriptional regulator